MSIFTKLVRLSKRTAAAILRNENPTDLFNSDLFTDQDKKYIHENLTDEQHIQTRRNLANQIDTKANWKKVKNKIDVPVKKLPIWRYAAAAGLIIALASAFFLRESTSQKMDVRATPIVVNNNIKPGIDKAILTLDDGTQIALGEGQSFQSPQIHSNGQKIKYDATQNNSQHLVYNYLTIPRGAQFQLTLSDGTEVWLNSETQLKYPVGFNKGERRQVELVYGEAYFDVSPSTEHNGDSYNVVNDAQIVEVLGTEFNIKAYRDESTIYTTLVEGKIALSTTTQHQLLSPKQQAILNKQTKSLRVTTVEVYNEISWKDGIFSFEGKTLKDLMKVLSRWYDMDVIFQNKDLENIKFLGKLRKSQPIEKILMAIRNASIINNYEINNNTIILK